MGIEFRYKPEDTEGKFPKELKPGKDASFYLEGGVLDRFLKLKEYYYVRVHLDRDDVNWKVLIEDDDPDYSFPRSYENHFGEGESMTVEKAGRSALLTHAKEQAT